MQQKGTKKSVETLLQTLCRRAYFEVDPDIPKLTSEQKEMIVTSLEPMLKNLGPMYEPIIRARFEIDNTPYKTYGELGTIFSRKGRNAVRNEEYNATLQLAIMIREKDCPARKAILALRRSA